MAREDGLWIQDWTTGDNLKINPDGSINTSSAPASSASSASITAFGNLVTISTLGYTGITVHVTGSFVGTIQPYISINGSQVLAVQAYNLGTNTYVDYISGTGVYSFTVENTNSLQLYASSWSSGSSTVYWVKTQAKTREQASKAELWTGYDPDPSNVPTGQTARIALDASNRLPVHAAVSSDEGSDRDDFSGGALSSDWTSTIGTGGTVSVANSLATITSGTTNGSITKIVRPCDYAPFTASFYGTISQRIANQTIIFGLLDAYSSINSGIYVKFSGTTNTVCDFITQSSSAASDTQTTSVNIPNGTTATAHTYKLDLSNTQASFTIDGIVVATHTVHIPDSYTILNQHILVHNTGATGSSTSIVLNFVNFLNWNRIQVDTDYPAETLGVNIPEGSPVGSKANKNKTYVTSVDYTLATSGVEARAVLIRNTGTKTLLFRRLIVALTNTTGSQAIIKLYSAPTITSNGTAGTILSSNLGSSAPTSTASIYTAPTITSNGTRLFSLLCGGGTTPTNIVYDFDLGIGLSPAGSVLLTGTPDGTNRILNVTFVWDEV